MTILSKVNNNVQNMFSFIFILNLLVLIEKQKYREMLKMLTSHGLGLQWKMISYLHT